jgi:mono/diheme cytochrome c family protein
MTACRLAAFTLAAGLIWGPAIPAAGADTVKGEYIFRASGGCSCHTKPEDQGGRGAPDYLAGGRALKTPFGTFFSTNITPDKDSGIGGWTRDDFVRSMSAGVHKNGQYLYPVFPFTSFTRMSEDDLGNMFDYLQTIPAIERKNQPHDVMFPMSIRLTLLPWRWMFLDQKKFTPDAAKAPELNRGDYLVNAVAHCGECHTARNILGGVRKDLFLAGSKDGPEGIKSPNITPDKATGIGDWSIADISFYLKTGMTPGGDFAGSVMAEVIDEGYKHLSDADLGAIAAYLKSVKAIENKLD